MSTNLNDIVTAVLAMAFIIIFFKIVIKVIKELHSLGEERNTEAQKAGKQGSKKPSESLRKKANSKRLNRSTKRRNG